MDMDYLLSNTFSEVLFNNDNLRFLTSHNTIISFLL